MINFMKIQYVTTLLSFLIYRYISSILIGYLVNVL